jgi:hypothetical protein
MTVATDVPLRVRVSMAHAAVQVVADRLGLDVLHIKGAALDPSLNRPGRDGTDADLLVRPRDVERLTVALRQGGWGQVSSFQNGSPFGHAATLHHATWGYADVHRLFPGIMAPPAEAFERLWDDHHRREIAGVSCPVPAVTAQRLLLVLNAGRARGPDRVTGDVEIAWNEADAGTRALMEGLAHELDAHVALAAATGNLDYYRHSRDYALWRVLSEGGTRLDEWRARIAAAPSRRAALRLAVRAPLVNIDHLEARLGRRSGPADVIREFFARPRRAFLEEVRTRTQGGRRG